MGMRCSSAWSSGSACGASWNTCSIRNELLSEFGIRSLSARYRDEPYTFWVGDQGFDLPYWPAESKNKMFGGNSNWRDPSGSRST